jgi:hypothetical protein
MTTLLRSGLLAGLFAGVIWGQDALLLNAPPALRSAVKRLVRGPHPPATIELLRDPKGGVVAVIEDTRPKVCAARLLEAIPNDSAFNMPQLRPDEHTEPMPLAKLPAPPCPKLPD